MTFTTSDDAAKPALEAVKKYSTQPGKVASIDEAEVFVVDFAYSRMPPSQELRDVWGWSYLGLYGSDTEAEPIATVITGSPDPAGLGGYAAALASSQVNVWLNSDALAGSEGRMIAAALHELELHVLPFYDFHLELMAAQYLASVEQTARAEDAIKALGETVKAGAYGATSQHTSAGLRAAQVLASLHYVCDKVAARAKGSGSKRKSSELTLDSDTVEYAVLISAYQDVVGEDSDALTPIKQIYDTKLGGLKTAYGEDVVTFVVEQFELGS